MIMTFNENFTSIKINKNIYINIYSRNIEIYRISGNKISKNAIEGGGGLFEGSTPPMINFD